MKSIQLFDAKNRFSEICEAVVASGEPLLVTRRGRPWVRVVPAHADTEGERASVWDTVVEGRRRFGLIKDKFDLPQRDVAANRASPLD